MKIRTSIYHRTFAYVMLVAVIFCGCELPSGQQQIKVKTLTKKDGYSIIEIESCEYIEVSEMNGYYSLTHKGNCKFCAERIKK